MSSAEGASNEPMEVDTDLYSRQMYTIDLATLKSLSKVNALVWGLTGLGVEVAKNLILAGLCSVTVCDPEPAVATDLSAQFYLSSDDVLASRSRASASAPKLAELNRYVKVRELDHVPDVSDVTAFQVIVCCSTTDPDRVRRLATACHASNVPFIRADIRGVFSRLFVDFGASFHVRDRDNMDPDPFVVTHISQSNPCVIKVAAETEDGHEAEKLMQHFDDGDTAKITEVQGMDAINDVEGTVKVLDKYTLQLDVDTSSFPDYVTGGLVNVVKTGVTLNFLAYEDALGRPRFQDSMEDWAKFGRSQQMHVIWQALDAFVSAHTGDLPTPSDADVTSMQQLVKEVATAAASADGGDAVEVDAALVSTFVRQCRGHLNPMAAFMGGVVAQEVLKVTGKFTPIHQFFYFDAEEALPAVDALGSCEPEGARTDGQVVAMGTTLQHQLAKLRVFVVGAGALGCELLKNLAMMGVATREMGLLSVTDMDSIEKSNLNRQFLFRPKDIGAMKSTCAARAAAEMNPDLKVRSYETSVGPDTGDVFTYSFWEAQDLAINALDTWTAREFVDTKCVEHKKPLLESGTKGASGHTQVILPYMTINFGARRPLPERQLPVCTVKNFPYKTIHTIHWSRELFDNLFMKSIATAASHIEDDTYVSSLKLTGLETVTVLRQLQRMLNVLRQASFAACVTEARHVFTHLFDHDIRQLCDALPPDARTKKGQLVWLPPKRRPSPLVFNEQCDAHVSFVRATACLLAACLGIPVPEEEAQVMEVVHTSVTAFEEPPYVSNASADAYLEDEDGDEDGDAHGKGEANAPNALQQQADTIVQLTKSVADTSDLRGRVNLEAAKFEKDDSTNHHIAFVHTASTLRNLNYGIAPIDHHATKKIVGKIIPAIATTTAAITGLVCLELYKVVAGKGKPGALEPFKECNMNMSDNTFCLCEPEEPPRNKSRGNVLCVPEGYTCWDTIDIRHGDLRIAQLASYVQSELGMELFSVTYEGARLWARTLMRDAKARWSQTVTQLLCRAKGWDAMPTDLPFVKLSLVLSPKTEAPVSAAADTAAEEGAPPVEVDVAPVRFFFRDSDRQKKHKKKDKKHSKKSKKKSKKKGHKKAQKRLKGDDVSSHEVPTNE